MLSRRTSWPRTQNALSVATDARLAAEQPILDLTRSNPGAVGLAPPAEPILRALSNPRGLAYRPDPHGLRTAREAIARWLSRDGRAAVSPERIVLTASTSEAYAFLFGLLGDPADRVLVPAPSYPLFDYLTALAALEPHPYRLAYDGSWRIDREALLDGAGPTARAVVAIHPNNPTGSYLGADELGFLGGLCAARGLALISDEVFIDYALRDDPDRAPSASAQSDCLTFVLGGLSKAAGLPQLKLGWIAASGPESLVGPALLRLELIADSYLSVSSPVQEALPSLLELAPAFQAQVRARLAQNLAAAKAALAPPSPGSVLTVEGGWTLVLRVPAIQTGAEWAQELLCEEGLLVQPGYFYDFEREAYLVVSLLTPPAEFAEGFARLRRALDQTPAR